jgi:formylmethanofuran dehydrogenase subunit E-like metal-binding protein
MAPLEMMSCVPFGGCVCPFAFSGMEASHLARRLFILHKGRLSAAMTTPRAGT